jgi:hypothetical protein
MNSSAAQLLKDGYLILPSAYPGDLRGDLEKEFMRMPEFKHHPPFASLTKTVRYGCGATSFLGCPSVFHNQASRLHRIETHKRFLPLFSSLVELLGRPDLLLNILIDRIQVRPPGETPQKESWHRDVMPSARQGEFCIGGWENCDEVDQKFCGLKGTHTLDAAEIHKTGFASIPKADHPKYDAMLLAQANHHDTDKDGKIVIPPKHFILFFANMVHAVNSQKLKHTSVKQFLGFRLSPFYDSGIVRPDKSGLFSFQELEQQMLDNAVLVLSSGQVPPMYPANYLVVQKQLSIFETFQTEMLVQDAMKIPLRNLQGQIQHKARKDETRSMKSLTDLGLPLHPPYSKHEMDLIRPHPLCDDGPAAKRLRL